MLVRHFKHGERQIVCVDCIPLQERDWRSVHKYAVGMTKPNYPVPAIAYEYDIDTHGKCVWVEDNEGRYVELYTWRQS